MQFDEFQRQYKALVDQCDEGMVFVTIVTHATGTRVLSCVPRDFGVAAAPYVVRSMLDEALKALDVAIAPAQGHA